MTDKSKVATVVLAGLAAGAAAWYLFSTEKGREVCEKLTDSLSNLGESIKDIRSKAADTLDQISGQAEKVAGNFKSKAEDIYPN